MNKRTRLIFLALSLITLIGVGRYVSGNFDFILKEFWFTSGFLLLILLSLIDQPHFSKDSSIFINAVTAGISLLLVPQSNRNCIFWLFLIVVFYLAISSYFILLKRDKPLNQENKWLQFFSRINKEIGKPQTLFSAFFLWGAINKFGINSSSFNALLLYWVIFMIFNLPGIAKIFNKLFETTENKKQEAVLGEIFGVQSRNTFLVKLFPERTETIKLFDFVEFIYSIDEKRKTRKGLIFDTYLLNEQQWIKVLTTTEINQIFGNKDIYSDHTNDFIYLIKDVPETEYLDKFIGIITENSTIGKIRFIYNSRTKIAEGQLLEVNVQGKKVLYQIIEGITKIETLEQKNQTGLIIGEAIQLGTWNNEKLQFEQFGWVPEINTPVYIASKIEEPNIEDNEYLVGKIPNTNYPVIINKDTALSHHLAVIGVTGTGKSIFSRNLVRQYLKDENTKVICIDFTGEYVNKFSDLKPIKTIADATASELFKKIDKIEIEIGKNYNKDNDISRQLKKEVSESIDREIETFLKSENKISIFELPDVANTSGVLTYTKTFFRILFYIAKTKASFGKRICIVLEEAHTVIPEWNFSGVSDKISQPLLNSIAQIALQGRKYNVGLLVIAQRTANVSKTILTQCNTVISFQEFDKTSSDFLANYFGQDISTALPKLKFRQAIAAGKALKSSVPMIFEVPFIKEPENGEKAEDE
jgi:hypothetical protein